MRTLLRNIVPYALTGITCMAALVGCEDDACTFPEQPLPITIVATPDSAAVGDTVTFDAEYHQESCWQPWYSWYFPPDAQIASAYTRGISFVFTYPGRHEIRVRVLDDVLGNTIGEGTMIIWITP